MWYYHFKWYSYHACTGVIVSGGGRNATVHDPKPKWNAQTQEFKSRMDANMQLRPTIYSFRPLFPDKIFSLTFRKIPDISLTAAKIPDISGFSRQVVSLYFLPLKSFLERIITNNVMQTTDLPQIVCRGRKHSQSMGSFVVNRMKQNRRRLFVARSVGQSSSSIWHHATNTVFSS